MDPADACGIGAKSFCPLDSAPAGEKTCVDFGRFEPCDAHAHADTCLVGEGEHGPAQRNTSAKERGDERGRGRETSSTAAERTVDPTRGELDIGRLPSRVKNLSVRNKVAATGAERTGEGR